jgi:hypothetical protein
VLLEVRVAVVDRGPASRAVQQQPVKEIQVVPVSTADLLPAAAVQALRVVMQ